MNRVLAGRPKRLLVIVNPFGGDKSGRRVYTTIVEPFLKAAGISFTMQGMVRLCLSSCHAFFYYSAGFLKNVLTE